MRRFVRLLRRDSRGISAVEFAMIAPVFILLVVGIVQMGHLFYAHAGLRNAVSEGARFATISPRPTAQQVIDFVNANRATLDQGSFTQPTVTYTRNAATDTWYADISMSYSVGLDFILFETPVTLNYTRRAWVHSPPA